MIFRWREERKRRYPTQDNIQKKNEAEKAIEEAGGLVPQEKKLKETVPSEKKLYEVIQGKRLALCKQHARMERIAIISMIHVERIRNYVKHLSVATVRE